MTMDNARNREEPVERRVDVAIIGAGVVGSALAFALSHLRCSVAVIEKESDVGMAATARNSGVIHAGINYAPGSLRARFCMRGRELLMSWCDELNVPYRVCGKLIVASRDEEINGLDKLQAAGKANGVPGMKLLDSEAAAELQPGIRAVAALHVPSSGIVSPYAFTLAMAEEAAMNGVRFHLGCRAERIRADGRGAAVETDRGTVFARWVFNAAGIHAGRIAQTIDPDAPDLYPCIGEYLILDKQAGESLAMSVYPAPPAGGAGLGVHLTPTTEGNVLLGPSDEYVSDCEQTACSGKTADRLLEEARAMWPGLPANLVIGAYAGIRAKRTSPQEGGFGDFLIQRSSTVDRVIHLLGIESPGLTAAPAIAEYLIQEILGPAETLEPIPARERTRRPWPTRFDALSEAEKVRRVAEDPDHGDIICRCEGVTKAEFLHAVRNPLGVRTLSGIKYRCRATMGRCSGGYCLPRIVEILQEEHGWRPEEFTLRGPASPSFVGSLIEEETDD
jgi:glycerol-3-phosphate dehydrogenase